MFYFAVASMNHTVVLRSFLLCFHFAFCVTKKFLLAQHEFHSQSALEHNQRQISRELILLDHKKKKNPAWCITRQHMIFCLAGKCMWSIRLQHLCRLHLISWWGFFSFMLSMLHFLFCCIQLFSEWKKILPQFFCSTSTNFSDISLSQVVWSGKRIPDLTSPSSKC